MPLKRLSVRSYLVLRAEQQDAGTETDIRRGQHISILVQRSQSKRHDLYPEVRRARSPTLTQRSSRPPNASPTEHRQQACGE
ncbi:hypothetical protein NM688_g2659 [Phlebia brevispora]|uniref:Uncharacterized protein n=1 Tax=Phlebia brevispora TaxID=194682 RepID=A0ACC1T7V8_9APHY|nr:hypothetical protein NM688_g2659 [Phlebia brevispora]